MEVEKLHIQGCDFIWRKGTNDADTVRSVFQDREYALPDNSQYVPGSVCVDIGAHIGSYSVWARKEFPDAQVLALEPLPENLHMLSLNAHHALIVPGCVGTGSVNKIHYPNTNTEAGRMHRFVGNGSGWHPDYIRYVLSAVWSLAELLHYIEASFNRRTIWAIKLDCEGGEYGLLEEASLTDLRRVKWFVGEFHQGEERLKIVMEKAGFLRHSKQNRFENMGLFCYENPDYFADL